MSGLQNTVRPRHLAPDDSNLGASLLLLASVNICDFLAQVKAEVTVSSMSRPDVQYNILCRVGVINTLDLNQARLRVGGVPTPLVAQVTPPFPHLVSNRIHEKKKDKNFPPVVCYRPFPIP